MKIQFKPVLAAVAAFATFFVATPSEAMAAFARQTGMSCTSCHFQHYPLLNETGRAFKSGGYTMMGKQGLIDGDGLSIPEVLNVGLTTKIRYQKSNGPATTTKNDNTNDGQLQFPDEFLLQLGGRISENIGFIADINLNNGGESVMEGAKIPFIYNVSGINIGVIPFTTVTQGVAYGFELLNTGAVRGQRAVEARKTFSAQQYINTANAAEGAAIVASNSLFFANISKWSPRSVTSTTDGTPSATYLRAAITPTVGAWDLGLGLQLWTGKATQDSAVAKTGEDVDTKAWSLDAQAQGSVATLPLGIYFTHAQADASSTGSVNLFNSSTDHAKSATTLLAELGVMPSKATVTLGYRNGDNGKATNSADNALLVGGSYQIVKNVQLQLNQEFLSGDGISSSTGNGDQLTTLMLFAAF
ncbi:MAG: hypothetical protein Q7S59_00275 [Sulfurimonas sp.]|nr:hypothetical protein [Sulfurimonas sp.]